MKRAKKEEEKFDFTSEGESLGYISLDQARVLALRTGTEAPGSYGRAYRDVSTAFEVAEAQETEDHYIITLSIRPPGGFAGTPGREQFFVEKEGTVRLRQILSLPVKTRRWIGFPSVLLGIIVAGGALVGILFVAGIFTPSSTPALPLEPGASASAVNTLIIPEAPTQLESPSGQVTIQLGVGAVDIPGLLWYQQLAPDQVAELPEGYLISDKVFDVSIAATKEALVGPTSLIRPITITVRLSTEDAALAGGIDSNVVLQKFQLGDNRWVVLDTTVDFSSSIARAQVNSLSVFALTIKTPKPSDTPGPVLIPTSAPQVALPPTGPVPTSEIGPSPVPTITPEVTPTPQPPLTKAPTPTPTPIPAPTPTPMPVVTIKTTSVSRNDSPLGLHAGYGSTSSVRLATFRPSNLDAPGAEGTGYYGLLPVGTDGNLGVMVDVISIDESCVLGTAYFSIFSDGSLTNGQEHFFEGRANSDEIILLVDYGQESEFVSFRADVYGEPAEGTDDWSASIWANLYINTLYIGQVPGTSTYFLIDSADSARFDTPQTRVFHDVDHDGFIFSDVTDEVQTSANATIIARQQAWEVVSISPSGREVTLSPAGTGSLSGQVRTFVGAQAIAGATVQVWPGPYLRPSVNRTGPTGWTLTLGMYGTCSSRRKGMSPLVSTVPWATKGRNVGVAPGAFSSSKPAPSLTTWS